MFLEIQIWLDSEDLARATGSSSMISLRNQETLGGTEHPTK